MMINMMKDKLYKRTDNNIIEVNYQDGSNTNNIDINLSGITRKAYQINRLNKEIEDLRRDLKNYTKYNTKEDNITKDINNNINIKLDQLNSISINNKYNKLQIFIKYIFKI